MKAAQINEYGGKDVVQITSDAAKPSIEDDQVLVEVKAAAVNPFDWKVREGYAKDWVKAPFPLTLGGDVSGVVAEVGRTITDFQVGDEVFGQANAVSGNGSLAEYAPVKAASLTKKPLSLSWINAASIPLAGSSAVQALFDHMNLQSGQSVLIQGGAGGIGSFAVQLAKQAGATVYSTGVTDQIDFIKSLGADEVFSYETQDFSHEVKGLDGVFDTVGGETFQKSHKVLKPGGTIVSMVAEPDEQLAKEYNVRQVVQQSQVTRERLNKLAAAVADGNVRINVERVFPLDEAAEALDYLQNEQPKGKVVVKIRD